MLVCFSRLNLVELGLLCVCFWKIWSQRNAYVNDSVLLKDLDVVVWARGFLAEVHDGRVIKSRALISSSISSPVWVPPDPDLYKINCDAAIDVIGRLVGFGIVTCDSEGFVMASSSQKIEASFSPQIEEATTILRDLQLAWDTGLSPCRIDSDAEVIVNWINNSVVILSEVGSVIDDICLFFLSDLSNGYLVSIRGYPPIFPLDDWPSLPLSAATLSGRLYPSSLPSPSLDGVSIHLRRDTPSNDGTPFSVSRMEMEECHWR
ncbi:hypothetical protein Ddye_028610 [Dipteronia dyeriana]|uniref:RNase H type-1 domain-containing protein n=1 Tax=Dipteronia dyeriana TaxID=168575 RepID=A0AAD9TE19_9ROSI|nr:hypothetical protein Ddye_028610 [Dipteronia dyeriana]